MALWLVLAVLYGTFALLLAAPASVAASRTVWIIVNCIGIFAFAFGVILLLALITLLSRGVPLIVGPALLLVLKVALLMLYLPIAKRLPKGKRYVALTP